MHRFFLIVCFGWWANLALAAESAPTFFTSPTASVLVWGGNGMNGDHFVDSALPALRKHFAGVKKVVLVLYGTIPSDRARMEKRLKIAFAHLGGIAAESLHAHDAAGQRALLENADGIFVSGGETFVLLSELYRTGQLELIRARVLAGVPYGGTSAGANVAGLLIGTTNDFPTTEIPSRTALGVFPAVINPHHPRPADKGDFDGRQQKIRIYLQFNPTETVLALGNASIARLNAGRVTLEAGQGWLYRASGVRELNPGDELPELTVKP